MSEIRKQAVEFGSATLEQFEECVYLADHARLPVLDATIVMGNEMLDHDANAAFLCHVERVVYDLVVHKGFCFAQQPTGEIKFVVPSDAWTLKVEASVHMHPKRTCCGMFQILVVIQLDALYEIKVPHAELVPRLGCYGGAAQPEDIEEEEEEEEEEGEEEARSHMRSQEEWSAIDGQCARIPVAAQRI